MNQIIDKLNELDMENIIIIANFLQALTDWEYENKYYNGKYQIIQLHNFNNEIFIAHNLFDFIKIEDSYKFIESVIDVFKEYDDKQYLINFWDTKLNGLLK